jgi:hypothetical protein
MPREATPPNAEPPADGGHEPGDELLNLEPRLATPHPAPRHWPATASPWATALVDLRQGHALAA